MGLFVLAKVKLPDWVEELTTATRNALLRNIEWNGNIAIRLDTMTEKELSKMRGIGKKALCEIMTVRERG